ncbi:hypothetical protein MYA_5727 [Burkholderia sp. KJ006]|nr:hypothetical protein MYA_5727 [Burkholderia sp. KJ006]
MTQVIRRASAIEAIEAVNDGSDATTAEHCGDAACRFG